MAGETTLRDVEVRDSEVRDDELRDVDIDELTALALATDPDDVVIDDDAVPFGVPDRGADLLPEWYMPAALRGGDEHRVRRSFVVGGIVLALLIVNGVGICVTYGVPEVGDRVFSGF